MADYTLDRLFGLALTDARFFRELRENTPEAITQFDLSAPEEHAVLCIAPIVRSIEELAKRLDSWMNCQPTEPVAVHSQNQPVGIDCAIQELTFSENTALKIPAEDGLHLPRQDATQAATHTIGKGYA